MLNQGPSFHRSVVVVSIYVACSRIDGTNIDYRLVILDTAENFEAAKFPFATFRCVHRSHFEAPVD